MKTQNTTANNQSVQDLTKELGGLLTEAEKVNQEIDEMNKKSRESMDEIDTRVNKAIDNLEQIYSDLDKIEGEAGEEFDELLAKQEKDLAL